METRSSRHLDENVSTRPKSTRTSKNKYLYDEVNNKIGYEEIDDFSRYGDFELDSETPIKTREEYQKREILREEETLDNKEELPEEEKVYDINSVLEEAKKNRVIPDELEKKRKLQNAEYNILSDLNKKYINKKEKIEEDLEKEGIRELIDTITSKTLSKDILSATEEDDGKDLMSDLLATNTSVSVLNDINLEEEIAKEILVEKNKKMEEHDEIVNDGGNLVNSFYTRSMDLTEQDFEIRDEIVEENKEKRRILILVVLIVLVIVAIVGILILKKIDVI